MKAVVFAGYDSVESLDHRRSCLEIPEVRARLREADTILAEFAPEAIAPGALERAFREEKHLFHQAVPQVLSGFATQVGLYEAYVARHGKPDWLLGCSLGDLARTVVSGAIEFSVMLRGLYLYTAEAVRAEGAATLSVKSSVPVTDADFETLDAVEGVELSVHQTPFHFTVAGTEAGLARWVEEYAQPRGLRARRLSTIPMHSRLMAAAAAEVETAFGTHAFAAPDVRIFSSVLGKELAPAEMRDEIRRNMVGTVHWCPSLQKLVAEEGVDEIVNIGPAATLLKFAQLTPLAREVRVVDAREVLHAS